MAGGGGARRAGRVVGGRGSGGVCGGLVAISAGTQLVVGVGAGGGRMGGDVGCSLGFAKAELRSLRLRCSSGGWVPEALG